MEPSILEYARFHGVAQDHLAHDPVGYLQSLHRPDLAISLLDPVEARPADDALSFMREKQKEKLDISRSGAVYLSSVIKLLSSGRDHLSNENRWDAILPNYKRIANLRPAEPVLRGDHELDMLSFRAQISLEGLELDLPLEDLNTENDESLDFPEYSQEVPDQIYGVIAQEKLDCSRESLYILQQTKIALTSLTTEVHDRLYDDLMHPTAQLIAEQITPPLLPREPSPTPFEPSIELELLPDRDPTVLPEYATIGELLAEDSQLTGPESTVLYENKLLIDFPVSIPAEVEICKSPKRPLLADLKVDGPITPPVSTKKPRLRQGELAPMEHLQMSMASHNAHPEPEDSFPMDTELTEMAESAMKVMEGKLKDEKIRSISTSIRSNIPDIANLQISPPWSASTESPSESVAPDNLITRLTQDLRLRSRLEADMEAERRLPWNPFPNGFSRLEIMETIAGTPAMEYLVLRADVPLDMSGVECLPRQPNPRLAFAGEHTDDMEDLKPRPGYSGEKDAAEISSPGAAPVEAEIEQPGETVHDTRPGAAFPLHDMRGKARAGTGKPASLLEMHFSAQRQLTKFMNTRGQNARSSEKGQSPYFKPAPSGAESRPAQRTDTSKVNSQVRLPQVASELREMALPVPEIPDPPGQRVLMLSSSLLRSQRELVRKLESLSPPAVLVFRDCSPSPTAQDRGSTTKAGHKTASAVPRTGGQTETDEAGVHVILSPKAAVLLTTSQETTQRYLPGHRPSPSGPNAQYDCPLHEHVARASPDYELLYILIRHASTTGSEPLTMDSKTADSIRSLTALASSLRPICHVIPLLVPFSVEFLLQWIVSLSNKHHFSWPAATGSSERAARPNLFLTTEDPTTWELFLRRTGLNPYAAQVVLSVSPVEATGESGPGGNIQHRLDDALAWFVGMDPRERRRIFAPVLGERVLARVEKQLDTGW